MPQVVKVDADEPGCVERRAPDPREVAAAELGTFRAGEDQAFGSSAGEGKYDRPVGVGPLITVDTTVPVDVASVAAEVRRLHGA